MRFYPFWVKNQEPRCQEPKKKYKESKPKERIQKVKFQGLPIISDHCNLEFEISVGSWFLRFLIIGFSRFFSILKSQTEA
jgi:hypothetical protein